MMFEDWWGQLSTAEQKMLGKNNAKFVWEEARAHNLNMLTLPNYMISRTKDKAVIMSFHGEGGSFNLDAFDKAVSQFFAENF
jgi:hypothetical protein